MMPGFTDQERQAAAELLADAEARIADITRRTKTASTPEEHVQLGRERASAFGDLKSARFVLTEKAVA